MLLVFVANELNGSDERLDVLSLLSCILNEGVVPVHIYILERAEVQRSIFYDT
jgi:hypothetical protein